MDTLKKIAEIVAVMKKRDYEYTQKLVQQINRKSEGVKQKLFFDFYLPDYALVIDVEGSPNYNNDSGFGMRSTNKAKRFICTQKDLHYLLIEEEDDTKAYDLILDKISDIVREKYEPYVPA